LQIKSKLLPAKRECTAPPSFHFANPFTLGRADGALDIAAAARDHGDEPAFGEPRGEL